MHRPQSIFKSAVLAGVLMATAGVTHAQDTGRIILKVDKAKFEDIKTPKIAHGTKTKTWTQKEWLEIEVKFKVEKMEKEPKDKTLPKLTVKWFVVVQDPNSKKKLRLTQEVNHVNIPMGEDMYTSVYISPSGIRRLTNGENASKRAIIGVGGEFFLNGKAVPKSKFSSLRLNKKKPWWESPNLSESKSIKLHSKNETPFKYLWYDRYAEVEEKQNSSS